MKFASNRISIYPDKLTALSGLQFRDPKAATIGIDECNLRIAWLQIDENNELVFFLADLLFFPTHLAKLLAEYLQEQFNIPKAHLVFAATHNHSGPALGFLPWEKENHPYEEKIFHKTKTVLDDIRKQLKPTTLSIDELPIRNISINRRKRVRHWKTGFARKALMLPNREGLTSESIKVLRFSPQNEKPTLFLSYASHPVFNRNENISSDYPGRLAQLCQSELAVKYAFCFQGFGGDLRPNFQGKSGIKAQLKTLLYGPEFADYTPENMEAFCQEIIKCLKKSKADQNLIGPGGLEVSEKEISIHSASKKTQRLLKLKVLSLGKKLKWLVVNGELFCQYQKYLPDAYFAISCTAGTIGYIPTAGEVKCGGYEVDDAPLNNGMDGPMDLGDLKKVEAYFEKLGMEKK